MPFTLIAWLSYKINTGPISELSQATVASTVQAHFDPVLGLNPETFTGLFIIYN